VTETDATGADAPVYEEHVGPERQYVRDIILGVNDGLVSMFLLVAGVVGGGLTAEQVLLTGIAGALAGAISMATGEYLATKSQDEVFDAEMALEEIHLAEHRDHERAELRDMLHDLGVPEPGLDQVVEIIDSSDEAMMGIMAALEFGVVDSERRSPYLAAVASGLLFLAGAAPSVVPFFFASHTALGLAFAGVLAGVGLFAVGAVKTVLTRKSLLVSGVENLAIGIVGGAVSYGVGWLFGVTVS
jgi:VIT1/CCC1 family predicted Fe2+/Mn2+ transporter